MKILRNLKNALIGMVVFVFLSDLFYLIISIGCGQVVTVVPDYFKGNELQQVVYQFIANCVMGFLLGLFFGLTKDVKYSEKSLKIDILKMYLFVITITIIPIIIFGLNSISNILIYFLIILLLLEGVVMYVSYIILKKLNQKDIKSINEKLNENK